MSKFELSKDNLMSRSEEADLYPIKCPCGCEETEEYDKYCEEPFGVVEHKLKCKKCGTYLGIWAYGNWSY